VQKTKEKGAKGRRMGLWIRTLGSTPVYPPLQVAAHRAQCFMPTPRAPHTQALTSGPRSRSSIGTGRQNGGAVVLKWNHRASRMCDV
jgi:hypothetical protein